MRLSIAFVAVPALSCWAGISAAQDASDSQDQATQTVACEFVSPVEGKSHSGECVNVMTSSVGTNDGRAVFYVRQDAEEIEPPENDYDYPSPPALNNKPLFACAFVLDDETLYKGLCGQTGPASFASYEPGGFAIMFP